MKMYAVLLIMLLAPGINRADTGTVVSVVDGNTLMVKVADEELKILLAGIDCPELDQAFGDEARKLVEKLLVGKEVQIDIVGKDRKGIRIATVTLLKNGNDPREELLRQGLAWVEEKNQHPPFVELQTWAREKHRGLWGDDAPTPPWVFRRQQTMTAPKSSSAP